MPLTLMGIVMSVFGRHMAGVVSRKANIGSAINHDARQGKRLRSVTVIEVHVVLTGELREPPREKLDRVGLGRHVTQSERIRNKLNEIGRKLSIRPTKVLLDLRDRYVKRLAEMN